MADRRVRLRHACTTLALLAAAWSIVLVVTSGVAFSLGPLHLSSRNARNPVFGAVLLLLAAAACAPAGARTRTLIGDLSRALAAADAGVGRILRSLGPLGRAVARPPVTSAFVALLGVLLLAGWWTRGAHVGGGSDSFGYVSEGHLFATGRLRMDLPLARAFPHVPIHAQAPLGYRPADDGSATLIPTYAPGLPLVIAVAEHVAGPDAVYAVMPILAALAIWFAYRLGVQLVGPGTGVAAALLLFLSPAFLFQTFGAPMSDATATGWWAMALSLLLHQSQFAVVGAGLAAGMAILTRPNLLLVVIVPGAYLLWRALQEKDRRTYAIRRLLLFSVPVVVACLTVAALNAAWYGSPLRSGYSADLFNLRFWRDNIVNYPRWLTETQTPLFFLGFAAPFIIQWLGPKGRAQRAEAWMLVGVALAVYGSYVFYAPFDAWWYLRFMLPAFPPLAVLTCVALSAMAARFGPPARIAAGATVLAAASFSYQHAKNLETLGDYRYRIMGEWVRDHLPERSVVLAMQHSGSIVLYSGRSIVRYDLLVRGDFESALDDVIAAGYHPYLVVDEWEMEPVKEKHGAGRRGALDWPAIAVLPLGNVRVFDLAEDIDAARASGRTPEIIPIPEFVGRLILRLQPGSTGSARSRFP